MRYYRMYLDMMVCMNKVQNSPKTPCTPYAHHMHTILHTMMHTKLHTKLHTICTPTFTPSNLKYSP